MPEFTVKDWLTVIGMAVVSVANFVAVREQVKGIKGTVTEILRQVEAIHKRVDLLSRRVTVVTIKQARQDERIKMLKDTQKFRIEPLK